MSFPLASTTSQMSGRNLHGPSKRDRIKALNGHEHLYKGIAAHPQLGVYKRFGEEWALCMSYTENKVHSCFYEVKEMLKKVEEERQTDETDEKLCKSIDEKMELFMRILEDHARRFHYARDMSQSPSPSQLSMDYYRAHLKGFDGNTLAANGEDTSLYGFENAAVPDNLTTLHNLEFDPIEEFLVTRLMNPFLSLVSCPLQAMRKRSGIHHRGQSHHRRHVNPGTISILAKFIVCAMANLSLAAAIGTLDSIRNSKLRIIVMTLFGQAFAASVQFIGSDSIPMYTLITAYFQVMVIFVGTTSDQKVSQ